MILSRYILKDERVHLFYFLALLHKESFHIQKDRKAYLKEVELLEMSVYDESNLYVLVYEGR